MSLPESLSEDRISTSQVLGQLPWVAQKLPSLLKGYYYFALLGKKKAFTVSDLLEENAKRYAHRPAILFEDREITYEALNQWANQYARLFQSLGLKAGESIAINLENRPELFVAVMGALKLGASAAMLNTAQKGHVLAHSISLIKPRLLIVGEEQMEALSSARAHLPEGAETPVLWVADRDTRSDPGEAPEGTVNLAKAAQAHPSDPPGVRARRRAGDTAVYLFTSGTTGLPKAAPSSHRKWFKAIGGMGHMSLALTPLDVIYVTLPFYHGTALLVCWGAALGGGAAIAVRRKFSASAFWDDVRRYQATCFGYVGELCRYLLNQPPRDSDRQHPLRKMLGNGLRPSIWKPFKERFGIEQVSELYGASEGNIGFSNFLNLDNTVGFSTAPFELVRFHEGTREPVRNEKGRLERVASGEPGLLLGKITGKWNFEGYTQKEATEKAIIRNAFRKGDAWFNTGDVLKDIGCRHLQFVDRMGDTFRWKGENVSTTEVENVFDRFEGIAEAIVYGVEIPGTNGKAGMATLVPAEGHDIPMENLLQYLNQELPDYAIPVFIRVTNEIEKTGTFKYRKVDLKEAGYQIGRNKDKVYIRLAGSQSYTPLDQATIEQLDKAALRF